MKKILIALVLITNTANADLSSQANDMLNQVANMMANELPKRIDRATVMAGITYLSPVETLTYRMAIDRREMRMIFEEEHGISPTETEMDTLLQDTMQRLSAEYACNGLKKLDVLFRKQQIDNIYTDLKIKYIYIVDGNFHDYLITGKTCSNKSERINPSH